jgi:hypothetical protein
MDNATRFEQLVQFRVPANLSAAIDTAAKQKCQSKSEYVRRSVIERLEADGVDPAHIVSRDAGALYDSVEGKRCYALISGDRIADIGYHAGEPSLSDFAPGRGDRVLPVVHQDSEPFDIAKHWRLPPIDRLEADRVVREFPVIPKSLEAI